MNQQLQASPLSQPLSQTSLQQLQLSVGQYSDKGRKESNQDFHGYCIPKGAQLHMKGAAFAVADGISSSQVSHIASETAVKSFLDDYYCTSDAWSVRQAATRVLNATNAWLYSQTLNSEYRYDKDKGYVSTLSALVLKATTAYLFHVGDSRIYRLRAQALEQLTKDHRLWVSQEQSYLSRAMGIEEALELDHQALPIQAGDLFIIATDGVYEHTDAPLILEALRNHPDNLDAAAQTIVEHAYQHGSNDNLTLQLIRVEALPQQETIDLYRQADELPFPPELEARAQFDGYTILREIHATSRSHVYLARDEESQCEVILKTPSIDLRPDPAYLERFLMEEWVARRVNSAHVLKAGPQTRKRNYLYTVTEYIEGQTLAQWLLDNPNPDLESVRSIVEQIARGLRALHRMEIIHQDLKPDNIMIDRSGTVKIIDFGAARVAGLVEAATEITEGEILGTALYTAPEYFLGEAGSARSDLYSLAVIAYQMLSGRFPYGTGVAKARTASAQHKLTYDSVLDEEREIPRWLDETLHKALHPNPEKRYNELSEFTFDLRHPNRAFLTRTRPPLLERNPVRFWQGVSALLAVAVIYLLNQ